jgi:hypothetical protein
MSQTLEHYVTLFDQNYIPQGINLYESMLKHCRDFQLWIMCMDENTYFYLRNKNLNYVKLLLVKDFENNTLLEVKKQRTQVEYCWTLSPIIPQIIFEQDKTIARVTYVDADIWFVKNPNMIFKEFEESDASVLITEHDYIEKFNQSKSAGIYCVQFMIYKKNGCIEILKKWESQCLEWCYNRIEDLRFGDQKYLDTWPIDFGRKVHVLQKKQMAQGPWNTSKFNLEDAVFYHFHQVRVITEKVADLGYYPLYGKHIETLYRPYLNELIKTKIELGQLKKEFIYKSIYLIMVRILNNFIRMLFRKYKLNSIWVKNGM